MVELIMYKKLGSASAAEILTTEIRKGEQIDREERQRDRQTDIEHVGHDFLLTKRNTGYITRQLSSLQAFTSIHLFLQTQSGRIKENLGIQTVLNSGMKMLWVKETNFFHFRGHGSLNISSDDTILSPQQQHSRKLINITKSSKTPYNSRKPIFSRIWICQE